MFCVTLGSMHGLQWYLDPLEVQRALRLQDLSLDYLWPSLGRPKTINGDMRTLHCSNQLSLSLVLAVIQVLIWSHEASKAVLAGISVLASAGEWRLRMARRAARSSATQTKLLCMPRAHWVGFGLRSIVYVCMYVRTYVLMYVCMWVPTYACMDVCMDVCMYGCMYVRLLGSDSTCKF